MVAVVSGNGAGIFNTSFGKWAQGAAGETGFLNIANGNLVLQRRDDFLAGAGLDLKMVRTYNSQGLFGEGTGRQWRIGLQKQVGSLIGALNGPGSMVTRVDADGKASVFRFNLVQGVYLNENGSQSMSMSMGANQQWTWRDLGGSGLFERYDQANGGRLVQAGDAEGVRLQYAYDKAGQVSQVRTAAGDLTHLDYDANGNLTQYRTVEAGSGRSQVRVRYAYDGQDRLVSVATDLSPEDGSVADGKVYLVQYGYDGDSARIASIEQSDGTRIALTYRMLDGVWKVDSVTDAQGMSRLDYSVPGKTIVTDAAGTAVAYTYDSQGRLTGVGSPSGVQQASFSYDEQGNIVRLQQDDSPAVSYEYDAHGRRVAMRDAAGKLLEQRTYADDGRLLAEIAYDANGKARETSHVYNAAKRLVFAVTEDGAVQEYAYNAAGQRTEMLRYPDARFLGAARTVAALRTWVSQQAASGAAVQKTAYTYDIRGLVASQADAAGTTRYIHDQAGQLVQRIAPDGTTTRYVYDGLGRLLAASTDSGQTNLSDYDKGGNEIVTSYNKGLAGSSVSSDRDMLFAAEPLSVASTESSTATPTITGTAGNDTVNGTAGDDVIDGGDGNDTIYGGIGNDIVDGGAGADLLYGEAGNDTVLGNDGNDTLSGGDGNDVMDGGDGYDQLWGGNGNDTITAGIGSNSAEDVMRGEGGADTYVYELGSGKDWIHGQRNEDTLRLGVGISPDDVTFARYGNNLDLVIRQNGQEVGRVVLVNQAMDSIAATSGVLQVVFADGTAWDMATMRTRSLAGTSGNDSLTGFSSNDKVQGGAGNDTIYGGEGDDVVDGGADTDIVRGEAGNDTVLGGDGNDSLYGGDGNDSMDGGDGFDQLWGGNGNDTMRAGVGSGSADDGMWGEGGADTYIYELGSWKDWVFGQRNEDTLQLGTGINPADVTFERYGDNLDLVIRQGGYDVGRVVLVSQAYDGVTTNSGVMQIVFADGTVWNAETIRARALIDTDASNGNLRGYNSNDTIMGNGGNDAIFGGGGSNVMDGGDGNDTIKADTISGAANNTNVMTGGTGNDRLESGASADTYLFNRGDSADVINDYDSGSYARIDRLKFGPGISASDLVFSRVGTYNLLIQLTQDGLPTGDQITVENWYNGGGAYGDEYQLEYLDFANGGQLTKAEVTALGNVRYGTEGNDSINDTLTHNGSMFGFGGNDTLTDAGGSDKIDGGAGNDSITDKGYGNNVLLGGDGADTIEYSGDGFNTVEAGSGNDSIRISDISKNVAGYSNVLTGGTGNDRLESGNSSDTYIFNRGDGSDTIKDYDSSSYGRLDQLVFGTGITAGDLSFSRVGSYDLLVKFGGNPEGDQVLIENWFNGGLYRIEKFQFADGSSMDQAAVTALANIRHGTEAADNLNITTGDGGSVYGYGGNDTITDTSGSDTIDGGSGNDSITDTGSGLNLLLGQDGDDTITFDNSSSSNTVSGGSGNDLLRMNSTWAARAGGQVNVLQGGTGNDRIESGNSADTYLFNRGDGADTINDWDFEGYGRTDRVVFGPGISRSDLSFRRNASNLYITINKDGADQGDSLCIENCFGYGGQYVGPRIVEEFVLADGTVMRNTELSNMLFPYVAGAGADSIASGSSADLIQAGDGDDTVTDSSGSDTIDGGAGHDFITDQGVGNNKISGGDGNDKIIYTTDVGQNTIDGGAGNDYIAGGGIKQTNTVIGGTGNDYIEGRAAVDTYIFNRGDGQDTIEDDSSGDSLVNADRIVFGPGISKSDLSFSRINVANNYDLLIKVSNVGVATGDSILIKNWYSSTGNYIIEQLEFADGSRLTPAEIEVLRNAYTGTEGADSFSDSFGDSQVFVTGGGNDTVSASGGNDLIDAGDGNDSLSDGDGNDTILAGAGDDWISEGAGYGSNYISGGDGRDTVYYSYNADNTVVGGAGDDEFLLGASSNSGAYRRNEFIGGAGNDKITSFNSSADTYYFSLGDGRDTIFETDGYGYNTTDRVVFGPGITVEDIVFSKANDDAEDLIVTVKQGGVPTGDSMRFDRFLHASKTSYLIEQFVFADGRVLTGEEVYEIVCGPRPPLPPPAVIVIEGTSGNDSVSGSSTNPMDVRGQDGSDTIAYGHQYGSTVSGGNGDDYLKSSSNGVPGVGFHTDGVIAELSGGQGNDRLEGAENENIYLFNRGDGQDTIRDYDANYYGEVDKLKFGAGISRADLLITRTGAYDVKIEVCTDGVPTGDSVLVENWFNVDRYGVYQLELIEFADGSTLTKSEITQLAYIRRATAGADLIESADLGGDVIIGLDGNDTLSDIKGGDDSIDGGAGNDVINGYSGNDTLDGGEGDDWINDTGVGNSILRGGDGNDTLRAAGTYTHWVHVLDGGAGNDLIQLSSDSAQETFVAAGTGNDRIEASNSLDHYMFNRGDGNDTIRDVDLGYYYREDQLHFGSNITPEDLKFSRVGTNNLLISLLSDGQATGDSITIEEFFRYDTYYSPARLQFVIEKFSFADGTSLSYEQVLALGNNRIGTEGADSVNLTDRDSTKIELLGGNDTLVDDDGSDITNGGAGDDSLTDNGYGYNILRGGDGHDTVRYSFSADNAVEGGAGNDLIKSSSTSGAYSRYNLLSGGLGDDRFESGASEDTYLFNRGDGNDTINDLDGSSAGKSDRIIFGAGISIGDLAFQRIGNYTLHIAMKNGTDAATDTITIENWFTADGKSAIERFEFADGSYLTKDEITLLGNVRYGTESSEAFNYPTGDAGTILAQGGDDIIVDDAGSDTIDGGAGNDNIADAGTGNNLLIGGDGNDSITFSQRGNNTVQGGAGSDTIKFTDPTSGGNQANVLHGGGGDDRIESGQSKDTYLFNRGDGRDTILDYDANLYARSDSLVFGSGIAIADLAFSRVDNYNLLIKVSLGGEPTGDQLVLENWFKADSYQIETFVFADGTSLSKAQVSEMGNVRYYTDSPDPISLATSDSGKLYALSGDDNIYDNAGSDNIYGGAGNDTIVDAGWGRNFLAGGEGNDSIDYSLTADNTIEGGEGNDIVTVASGSNYAYANQISGGRGNDRLVGRNAADSYLFNRGDGRDTIADFDSGDYKRMDRLVLGESIQQSDLTFSRKGTYDLLIQIGDSGNPTLDEVVVENWFNTTTGAYQLEQIVFADGSSMTSAQINALANVRFGTDGSDAPLPLESSESSATYGLGGNDTINGSSSGNDTIDGGSGNDSISDAGGTRNVLSGGDGADTVVFSNYSDNTVKGGAGHDLIKTAGSGSGAGRVNVLEGGYGNDRIESGASTDAYLFNRGDGQDTIYDYDTSGAIDRIRFGAGITQSQLKYMRQGSSLVIFIGGDGAAGRSDQITIENWFGGSNYQVERFEFADGSSVIASSAVSLLATTAGTTSANTIVASNTVPNAFGDSGNDTITGNALDNVIVGGVGNDSITDTAGGTNNLQGNAGNDTITFSGGSSYASGGAGDDLIRANGGGSNVIEGEAGNDRIDSSTGNETYIYGRGDGMDTIADTGGNDQDVLQFGPGIALAHLNVSRNGNNLVVRVVDPSSATQTDQITLENWFVGTGNLVEKFRFADGLELPKEKIVGMLAQDAKFGGLGIDNLDPGAMQTGSRIGRDPALALLNTGNGNFILQEQDGVLASAGLDVGLTRTYNSQAQMGSATWGNWQLSTGKSVRLDASTNIAYRSNGDGSESRYVYASGVYRSVDGQGAYDQLAFDAGSQRWTWTDGATGVQETYDASNSGRLATARDTSGNVTTYNYTSTGLLDYINSASGEKVSLAYDAVGNLKSVRVDYMAGGSAKTGTRIYYDYDSQRRLTMVRTDLTPDDNSIADGNVYWTMYSYDGDSGRIASITQKDGSALRLTYEQDAKSGAWWVKTMTDGLGRVTSLTRQPDGTTAIEDAAGHKVTYAYDADGKLDKVTDETTRQASDYSYDASGNVTSVTDANGVTNIFAYDAAGNQTLDEIAGVRKIERTFSKPGIVQTETVTADGQVRTSRYVYDAQDRLRFQVWPEGRVTEWRYNAKGEQTSMVEYAGATFNVSALAENQAPTEAALASWAAGTHRSDSILTDYTYDSRSLLLTATTYSSVAADGSGVIDGSESRKVFTYDHNGLLLQSIDSNNAQVSHSYDGLGRLVGTIDSRPAKPVTTTTVYDDAGRTAITTGINGNMVTEVFSRNGQLVSRTTSSAVATGTSRVYYDALGRPVMTQDAAGVRSFAQYDAAGRKVADIDGDGSVVRYVYGPNGQLTHTIALAGQVDTGPLVGQDGKPDLIKLATLALPAGQPGDRHGWNIYDSLGRLVQAVDAEGHVTATVYDGNGRVTSVIRHAETVDTAALEGSDAPAALALTVDAQDSVSRFFYDLDGNRLAELDGSGNLTEFAYDPAGQLMSSISYRQPTDPALRAAGSLAELRAAVAGSAAATHFLYNGKGQQVGSVDAGGTLTETVYDREGNVSRKVRYAKTVNWQPGATVASLRPEAQQADRSWSYTYTRLNQLETESAPDSVTRYSYDKLGKVVSVERFAGTPVAASALARYDVEGRIIGEVPAEAAWRIAAAGENAAAREAVWTNYGVSYQYDDAGRRISMTAPGGARTLYYYDVDGRLAHTVNTLGQVVTSEYNAFNQVSRSVSYGAVIPAATLEKLGGGNASALADAMQDLAPAAIASRTLYNENGQVAAIVDPLGALKAYRYDALGNVSESFAFATPVNPAMPDAEILAGIAAGTFADAAHDLHQRFAYDGASRLAATFTALQTGEGGQQWSVSTRSYDGTGNLLSSTTFAAPLKHAAPTLADTASLATSASDERVRIVYDVLGRVAVTATAQSQVDAKTIWTLQTREYDANGLLAVQRTLATQFTSAEPTSGELTAAASQLSTADAVVRYAYDQAGRVTHSATAQGVVEGALRWSVSSMAYDQAGNITERIEYAAGLSSATLPEGATVADYAAWLQTAPADAARDRATRYVYDAGNRLHYTIDALGAVTGREYDALGNVVQVTAYATPAAGTQSGSFTPAVSSADRVTRTYYDNANRAQYTVDAEGGVTEFRYDALGRVASTVAYANRIAMSTLTPASVPNDVAALVALKVDAANDRIERNVYDNSGRLRFKVDALGYVKEMQYDALGQVTHSLGYGDPTVLPEIDQNLPNLSAFGAAQLAAGKARQDSFEYDAQGHLVKATDGEQHSEYFRYDGAGNKTAFINKLGNEWRYSYNAAGQLTEEVAPPISVMGKDHALSTVSLATRMAYDALGNLKSRTEAAGVTGYERTTSYEYDLVGRQIRTVLPSFMIYNAAETPSTEPNAGLAEIASGEVAITVTYDLLGNAVSNRDVGGKISRKVYDKLGRVKYDVDAKGQVTGYKYDAFGRQVELTRHVGGITEDGEVQAHGDDRTIKTSYDRLGRVVKVVEPASHVYDKLIVDNVPTPGHADLVRVTASEYNGFGELRQKSVYGAESANIQNVRTIPAEERYYYNKRGERIAQFAVADSAGGYLTQTAYNAFGEVREITEFARKVSAAGMTDSAFAEVQGLAEDRKTTFDYDNVGQKKYDTRHNVDIGVESNGTMAAGVRPVTTAYVYDAVGNLLSTTDASGAQTRSYYDATGHVTGITVQGGEGGPLALTTFDRDVYGNVVKQTAYATAASFAPDGKYVVPAAAPADRTTWTEYDVNGHATSVLDAEGNRSFTSYDIYGRAAKQWQNVTSMVAAGVSFTRTTFTITQYDELGQVVKVITPGSASSVAHQSMRGSIDSSAFNTGYPRDENAEFSSYSGTNQVSLSYADLGNGPIKVELNYTTHDGAQYDAEPLPGQTAPSQPRTIRGTTQDRIFEPLTGATGVTLAWTETNQIVGGIKTINLVKVYVQDQSGQWVLKYQSTGTQLSGTAAVSDNMQGDVGTSAHENHYNVFGELLGKSLNGERYETSSYDNAGNMWRTNAGDGIEKVMYYNVAGQMTVQLRSAKDIDLASYASAQAAAQALERNGDVANGIIRNETSYDLMGRAVSQTGAAHGVATPGGSAIAAAGISGAATSKATVGWEPHATDPVDGTAPQTEWTYFWAGSNKVEVDFSLPEGLGSGDIRLEVAYDYDGAPAHESGTQGPPLGSSTYSQYLRQDQLQAVAGSPGRYHSILEWSDMPVDHVTALRVYKKDVTGHWVLLNETPAISPRGPFLSMPMPADGLAAPRLEYTLASGDVVSLTGSAAHNFGDATLFDLSGLPAGLVNFKLYHTPHSGAAEVMQENGMLLVMVDGAGKRTVTRLLGAGEPYVQTVRATSQQRLDRWGNVQEVTDPRNPDWFIRYSYNDSNQMTRQEQVALEHKPDNVTVEHVNVLAETFFDAAGREIGQKDGKGNLQVKTYGSDGRLAEERHADGGLVKYRYNLFGERDQMMTYTRANNYVLTNYAYDHLGHLAKVFRNAETWKSFEDGNAGNLQAERVNAAGEVAESYKYDELGRRTVTTNGVGGQRFVRYDHAGNVLAEVDETGGATTYAYDAYGHKTAQVITDDAGPRVQTWEVNVYGRVEAHQDAGGTRTTYSYTKLGQLKTQQSGARGNIAGQDLIYTFDGDQLVRVEDVANKQVTTYAYDLAGNRIREKTVANGRVVQDNHIEYDQLGRMTHVADGRYDVKFRYDEAGNRKEVDTYYIDANGLVTDIKVVNEFDKMNRQVLVDGDANADGKLGQQSRRLVYDWAGNRIMETYYATVADSAGNVQPQRQLTTELYTYDQAGRIQDTYRNGYLVDRRYYDAAGRVVRQGAQQVDSSGFNLWNLVPEYWPIAVANVMPEDIPWAMDAFTLAVSRGEGELKLADTNKMREFRLAADYRVNEYDAAGRMTRQKVRDLRNEFADDIYFKALPDRSAFENANVGYSAAGNLRGYYIVPANDGPQTTFRTTYQWFDNAKETLTLAMNNGGTTTTSTEYDGNGFIVKATETPMSGAASTRTYINDINGQVLLKTQGSVETHSLIVNGQMLGSSSVNAEDSAFANTYQGINTGTLAAVPSVYMVRGAGETPESIARSLWGDSKLWYLIADANALAGNEELSVGQTLHIPARVNTVRNDYQTFKPYNAADAVGSLSPTMPTPVVGDKGCGTAGTVIMVVVAVVVTYLTYGYAASYFGPGFAAGAAAGAAGSVASQGVGIAIGAQDKLSWKGVALSAVASGVSYGMAPSAGEGAKFLELEGTPAIMARSAVSNALSQGIGVVTGLQSGFNWRGVVAAGVGAGVGQYAGDKLGMFSGQEMGTMERLFKSTLVGFAAGTATAALHGGRISVTQVATDAFGNAIGSSFVDSISRPSLPSSMRNLPQEQQDRMLDMAQKAGLNAWSSDEKYDIIKRAADLRFNPNAQNLSTGQRLARTNDYLSLIGATDEQISAVNRSYTDAGIGDKSHWRSVPQGGGIEVAGTATQTKSFLGTTVLDDGVIGVGNVITKFGQFVDSNPIAKYALEGLDIVSGPVMYGVRHIPAVESLTGAAIGKISGFFGDGFSDAGRIDADVQYGAVGGTSILSVGATGFAGSIKVINNLTTDIKAISSLSRGEALRQKHSHLSSQERRAVINDRLESIAANRLKTLEQSIPGAHFQARHGAQTTLQQQYDRAIHGVDPATGQIRYRNDGSPVTPNSTRFMSNRDQINAIERATSIFESTGRKVDAEKPIVFKTQAGEGYYGGTGVYDTSFSAQVWFNNARQPITAFPILGR